MVGRKIALITDTHYGVRKGSQLFHEYFQRFYEDTFFPFLDSNNVDTVVHLGDVYDSRKGIDYWSLDWSKRVIFDELKKRNIKTYLIVGNHDIYYRNSLKLNSLRINP